MNNKNREQQMMAEAKAYTAEFYDNGDADFKTKEKIAETIADFCAGWRAAGQHPQWLSVEKELPKETGWYLVATPTLNSKIDVALWDGRWRRLVTITHWMPLPQPPRKEEDNE